MKKMPNNKHRLAFFLVLVLGLMVDHASLRANDSPESTETNPPNIVLILSDDQAWNDFGFMGHETIQTPNLDRLANESLTFKRG